MAWFIIKHRGNLTFNLYPTGNNRHVLILKLIFCWGQASCGSGLHSWPLWMIRSIVIHCQTVNGDMFLRNVNNTVRFKTEPAPKKRIKKYNECHEQIWGAERVGTCHSNQGRQRTTGYRVWSETSTTDLSIWALEPSGLLRWSEVVLTVITNSAWIFVIYLRSTSSRQMREWRYSSTLSFLVCYTGWRKKNSCFSNNCNFVYFQYKKIMSTPKNL